MSLRHIIACSHGHRFALGFRAAADCPFAARLSGRGFSTSRMAAGPFCSLDDVNKNVIKLEYAVRGPLVIRAGEIAKELQQVSDTIHAACDLLKVKLI